MGPFTSASNRGGSWARLSALIIAVGIRAGTGCGTFRHQAGSVAVVVSEPERRAGVEWLVQICGPPARPGRLERRPPASTFIKMNKPVCCCLDRLGPGFVPRDALFAAPFERASQSNCRPVVWRMQNAVMAEVVAELAPALAPAFAPIALRGASTGIRRFDQVGVSERAAAGPTLPHDGLLVGDRRHGRERYEAHRSDVG